LTALAGDHALGVGCAAGVFVDAVNVVGLHLHPAFEVDPVAIAVGVFAGDVLAR
jgi:hypothetical protein